MIMLLLLFVFCIENLYILYFSNFCINNDTILGSILQLFIISRPIFLHSKRFTDKFILQINLTLIQFFSILIFFTFFYLYFFKMCFLAYCLLNFKVIFINFPIPYFLAKKSNTIYFLKHSQQHINLSHRLTFGLP